MMGFLCAIVTVLLLGGCASNGNNLQCVDSKAADLTTVYWSSDDLHEIAESTIRSLLVSSALNSKKKKVFAFLNIDNDTYDHIDTDALKTAIKTSLVQSHKVRFIDIETRDMIHTSLDFQQKYHRYFEKIKQVGKELGIDGFLYGSLKAIYQTNALTKDMSFIFTLNLIDVETGEILWSENRSIRKIRKNEWIGW